MTHPFEKYETDAWQYRYEVRLIVHELHGGTPRNTKVAIDWLRAKLGITDVDRLQEMARDIVGENPDLDDDKLLNETVRAEVEKRLNGFRRDNQGLFLEGRHLKACLKEGGMVAVASGKLMGKNKDGDDANSWGKTNKGLKGFFAEHVMVVEDRLYLNRTDVDEIAQRFVVSRYGTSPSYEEVIYDAEITATIVSDYEFTEKHWAMIWLTAEQQGIGASRSQGYGRFTVTSWKRI